MDTLKNKKFEHYDYMSRYSHVPYYYDTIKGREVYGIGTAVKKNSPYVSHKLSATDTLDSLALKYYNNPTLWWVIASFNNILDPLVPLLDLLEVIKIPNISSIEFGDPR